MKYENIEDKLGLGRHILKIEPQEIWDDVEKKFQRGTQRTGISRTGNKWWMYSVKEHTDSKGHRFKILAFDQAQKELFDGGTIEMVVKEGRDWEVTEDGQPLIVNGKGVKKKKAFFNPVRTAEEGVREYAREVCEANPPEEEISMQDITDLF
jgi:hypothetical protein